MSRKARSISPKEKGKLSPFAFLALQAQLIAGRVLSRSARIKETAKAAAKSAALAPYKLEQSRRRERRRMVIFHSPEVGQSYTTTDGRCYYRHSDGSIRRDDTKANPVHAGSLRAAWQ